MLNARYAPFLWDLDDDASQSGFPSDILLFVLLLCLILQLSETRQPHIEEGLCKDIVDKIKAEQAWPKKSTACHTLFNNQCEFVCKASLWAD